MTKDIENITMEDVNKELRGKFLINDWKYKNKKDPEFSNITLPENIHTVGPIAFTDSLNLYRVTMEGVTMIGIKAFYNCKNLKIVGLPECLKEIKEYAFVNTGLYGINLPKATKVRELAFQCSNLKYAHIPNIDNLSWGVFADCKELEKVQILSGERVPEMVFKNCVNLRSITLPASVRYIGQEAFKGTNITQISIPEDTIVEKEAFNEGVEITRYQKDEKCLLRVMCQNYINSKNCTSKERDVVEKLMDRIDSLEL